MPLVRTPLVTSTAGKVLLAAAVLAATMTLPYLFPTEPSVSLSYVTHFSNRAATIIFATGMLLFAWLTQGRVADEDGTSHDQRLSVTSLVIALVYIAVLIWADLFDAPVHIAGGEFNYNANRVLMLVSGLRPYRDFEYAYGPLHLYIPWLCWKVAHVPPLLGYYAWWAFQWLAGTVVIWYIVRWMPFRQRWREYIFWAYLLTRSTSLWSEGTAYTPFRMVGAAFLILAVHVLWSRTRSQWWTVLGGVAAVALGMGIATEQAVGVAAGLLLWVTVLCWKEPAKFRWAACGVLLAGTAVIFAVAAAAHVFVTAAAFSKGAYSFPVAFSVVGSLILLTYLGAPCAALQQFARRDFESVTIPLALGGIVMLPSALGRCDFGHMQFASPAFICGIAWIETRPALRRMWTAAMLFAALIPTAANEVTTAWERIPQAFNAHAYSLRKAGASAQTTPAGGVPLSAQQKTPTVPKASAPPATSAQAASGQGNAAPPARISLQAPCAEIYRTPVVFPRPSQTPADACLETGYYMGLVNAFTEDAVRRKLRELDRTPRRPILLSDEPMDKAIPTSEADPDVLGEVESALFIPPARRDPLDFSEIADYIQKNYIPDPAGVDGYRVWRPKHVN